MMALYPPIQYRQRVLSGIADDDNQHDGRLIDARVLAYAVRCAGDHVEAFTCAIRFRGQLVDLASNGAW